MAASTSSALPVAAQLSGAWAGDRLQLTIDANSGSGRLETDCASGSFEGPLLQAGDGSFVASGHFEQHGPGPDGADTAGAGSRPAAARFEADLASDGLNMTLSIQTSGSAKRQIFRLRKGVKIKLIRCL